MSFKTDNEKRRGNLPLNSLLVFLEIYTLSISYHPANFIFEVVLPLIQIPNFLQIPLPQTPYFSSSFFKALHPPYFESKTSFHRPSDSDCSRQINFPNKALLKILTSFILNPPSSLDSHTFS